MKKDQIEHCRLLTTSTRVAYDSIGRVYCPILNEYIVFNARGFHHLFYEPDGTARTVSESIYKLTLFPLAIPVVKNATSVAEKRDVEVRKNRKKNAPIQKAKYYALVAAVGRKNPVAVRVILRRVGDGNLIFWSIMKD